MRKIPLSNSDEFALVDDQDYDHVMSIGLWHKSDTGYAVRRYKNSTLRMHRLIAQPPKALHVDHINRNRLDNTRSNLRIVSQATNAANGSGNHIKTVYPDLPKGVTYDYTRNKYVATRVTRKRFDNLKEAINFTKEA